MFTNNTISTIQKEVWKSILILKLEEGTLEQDMNLQKAIRIYELRVGKYKSHSDRRIAEIIEDEFPLYPELRGVQMHGRDLCREAAIFLIVAIKEDSSINLLYGPFKALKELRDD